MTKATRFKKLFPLAVATGIVCLSVYGIFHTADAYINLHASGDSSITGASSGDSLTSGGSVCNPLGCAACDGCAIIPVMESTEAQPDFGIQLEQFG